MKNRIIISQKHPLIGVSPEMDQILTPLKTLGITTLTFMRNYDDGHQIIMSTNPNWVNDYYNGNLCGNFISGHPKQYKQKFLIIPNESPLIVHQYAREKYNEGNSFALVQRYTDFTEFFFFAGEVSNKGLHNFFINNMDLFETFAVYFNDVAGKLIQTAEKNKILLPFDIYKSSPHPCIATLSENEKIKELLRRIKIKKYHLKSKNIKISRREIDCIAGFQNDLTAKELGRILNIHYRTVEKHVDNLKNKLGCDSKKDIIKILINDGFPSNILNDFFYVE